MGCFGEETSSIRLHTLGYIASKILPMSAYSMPTVPLSSSCLHRYISFKSVTEGNKYNGTYTIA